MARKIFKEPSSYAGLAAIIAGAGQIFQIPQTQEVAGAIVQAAPHFISGNWSGALMVGFGLASVFLKEKAS